MASYIGSGITPNEGNPYIQHFGVKGMKWGHRKSKAERVKAYQSKMAGKAAKKATNRRRDEAFEVNASKDLQKNGQNSYTYINDMSEKLSLMRARNAVTRGKDSHFDNLVGTIDIYSKTSIKSLTDEHNAQAQVARESAQKWEKRNKAIMNLPASATKRDIRRAYRGKS